MFKKILSGVLAAMLVVGTMMCTGCDDDTKINYTYKTTKTVYNSNKSTITVNGTTTSGSATVKYLPYGNEYLSGYLSSNLAKYSINNSKITITLNNVSFGKCSVTGKISNTGKEVTYTDGQSRKWTYKRV
ncbi:MAG: hypothetical protein E7490_07805 [Ruminococcaceae bacterium]|nr:hypothetical protein [Oscillospiraceae bacterium]